MKPIYRLARGLGWFSIALGALEFFDAGDLDRFLGTDDRRTTLRLFGLREIGAGMGILLSVRPPAAWLWARVAGDALDLSALGAAYASPKTRHANVTAALASVVGVTALDVYCACKLQQYENR